MFTFAIHYLAQSALKIKDGKLYKWLSQRFWLIIREEENLAPRFSITTSGFQMAGALALLLVACFALSFVGVEVVNALRRRSTPESTINRQIIELVMRVDSLNQEVQRKDAYINNIRQLIEGEAPLPAKENSQTPQANNAAPQDLEDIAPVDSAFRRQFESEAYDSKGLNASAAPSLKNMTFFAPIAGPILGRFDVKKKHFGIDIAAKKNEPVKAVADGSVILASWTQDSGHVIAIQHQNQLISFYKHNSVLLKKVGDIVRAGDIVAVVGNSGEYTDGQHLHFELWQNGNPVDPEQYIRFSF